MENFDENWYDWMIPIPFFDCADTGKKVWALKKDGSFGPLIIGTEKETNSILKSSEYDEIEEIEIASFLGSNIHIRKYD